VIFEVKALEEESAKATFCWESIKPGWGDHPSVIFEVKVSGEESKKATLRWELI